MIIFAGLLAVMAATSAYYLNPHASRSVQYSNGYIDLNNTFKHAGDVDNPVFEPQHGLAPEVLPIMIGVASDSAAVAQINSQAQTQSFHVVDVEQSLMAICRDIYWMGVQNKCSPDENYTWQFLLQEGPSGTLSSILGRSSSSTLSTCNQSDAANYGVYLLGQVFTQASLSGYSYNLNINDPKSAQTGEIGQGAAGSFNAPQADPCGYNDIVSYTSS